MASAYHSGDTLADTAEEATGCGSSGSIGKSCSSEDFSNDPNFAMDGMQDEEREDELKLPPKVRVTKGKNENKRGSTDTYRGVFDSVPFTPSQGVRTPSPNSSAALKWQMFSAPYSQHFPDSPHTMAYSPFMIYPVGFPTESQSPHHGPPSPLMGSPVGTPTAMMTFPQTPFAGVPHSPLSPFHSGNYGNNPFAPDANSPNGCPGYGYYHPIFSNFQPYIPSPVVPSSGAPSRQGSLAGASRLSISGCSNLGPSATPPPPPPRSREPSTGSYSPRRGSNGSGSAFHLGFVGSPAHHGSPLLSRVSQSALGAATTNGSPSPLKPASFFPDANHPAPPPRLPPSGQQQDKKDGAQAGLSSKRPPALHIQNPSGLGYPWSGVAPLHVNPLCYPLPLAPHLIMPGGPLDMFQASVFQRMQEYYGVLPPRSMSTGPVGSPIGHNAGALSNTGLPPFHHGFKQQRRGSPPSHSGGAPPPPPPPQQGGASAGPDVKAGPDGVPRLNARQRRTLRRAKDRAIKGLIEAQHVLVGGSNTANESDDGSDSDRGIQPKVADSASSLSDGQVEDVCQSKIVYTTASAVAAATNVLNKVACGHTADLDNVDIQELIVQLSEKKEEGLVDEKLIRDLQIIQNLLGALKLQGNGGTAGNKGKPGALGGIGGAGSPQPTSFMRGAAKNRIMAVH